MKTLARRILTLNVLLPLILLALTLLTLTLTDSVADAARPTSRRDTAFTDPALADADFEVQGEYLDRVRTTDGRWSYMGIQVVARGDGRFDGVLLRGGLPGAGWDQVHRESLHGESDGQITLLLGEQHTVTIQDRIATLEDSGGTVLGQLDKIHRISPTQGLAPPVNAIVLFDGADTGQLKDVKITEQGLLEIGATTTTPVRDFRLHIEFRSPYMPYALGQRRGNSGVYIQRRYEVQILDSFGLEGKHNECGGLYRQTPPDVNMCLPPLSWQTYDIHFTAARFGAGGKKTRNARLTVYHNGTAIHDDREVMSKTGAGKPEGPQALPIHFQNHGNPVHFRNMWLVLNGPVESPSDLTPADESPSDKPLAGKSVAGKSVVSGAPTSGCCYRPCRPRCRLRLFRRRRCR